MKKCCKCGMIKDYIYFPRNRCNSDGYEYYCKECRRIKNIKDKIKTAKYREENKERLRAKHQPYRDKLRYIKSLFKDAFKPIKQRISLQKTREKNRIRKANELKDPILNFKSRIRSVIYQSFSRKDLSKPCRTDAILCAKLEDVFNYLKQTAINNYGVYDENIRYHIDHIIPLSTVNTIDDILKLCHYTNLQYLKPTDNFKKNAKLDYVLEMQQKDEIV